MAPIVNARGLEFGRSRVGIKESQILETVEGSLNGGERYAALGER